MSPVRHGQLRQSQTQIQLGRNRSCLQGLSVLISSEWVAVPGQSVVASSLLPSVCGVLFPSAVTAPSISKLSI